jgi:hypothetical protein
MPALEARSFVWRRELPAGHTEMRSPPRFLRKEDQKAAGTSLLAKKEKKKKMNKK